MKAKLTLTTLTAIAIFTASSKADLILTGIVDGSLSGGTPKAIELYVLNDILDLSLYGVELVSNAGSTANAAETFFSGSATAGSFIYVASEAVQFQNVFGFAPDFTTGDVNHNGDDDFYIYGPGNTLIDTWGGSDGVDNSSTVADILDSWAYRNDGVAANPTFTSTEWTIAAINSLDGLDAAGINAAVPFGTYTAPVPEPGTYALLAGMLALASVMIRRRG